MDFRKVYAMFQKNRSGCYLINLTWMHLDFGKGWIVIEVMMHFFYMNPLSKVSRELSSHMKWKFSCFSLWILSRFDIPDSDVHYMKVNKEMSGWILCWASEDIYGLFVNEVKMKWEGEQYLKDRLMCWPHLEILQ